MVKRVISTNLFKRRLLRRLERLAKESGQPVWEHVANILSRPRRRRAAINLGRINRLSEDGDVIVVPGKVLGAGSLNKRLTIIAESFSKTALEKIKESGGTAYTLYEAVERPSVAHSNKGLKVLI